MDHILFQGWSGVGRVALVGVAACAALVLTLRIGGTRSLAELDAFDPVVTVALGSTLASTLRSTSVARRWRRRLPHCCASGSTPSPGAPSAANASRGSPAPLQPLLRHLGT